MGIWFITLFEYYMYIKLDLENCSAIHCFSRFFLDYSLWEVSNETGDFQTVEQYFLVLAKIN